MAAKGKCDEKIVYNLLTYALRTYIVNLLYFMMAGGQTAERDRERN